MANPRQEVPFDFVEDHPRLRRRRAPPSGDDVWQRTRRAGLLPRHRMHRGGNGSGTTIWIADVSRRGMSRSVRLRTFRDPVT